MANILLIDDDTDMHEIVGAFLTNDGHELRYASTGQSGLEQITEQTPDLIILDLAMPIMGGHEIYAKIREAEATATTPIMIMSVHADREVNADMKNDPHVSALLKPIDFAHLTQAVKSLLSRP